MTALKEELTEKDKQIEELKGLKERSCKNNNRNLFSF